MLFFLCYNCYLPWPSLDFVGRIWTGTKETIKQKSSTLILQTTGHTEYAFDRGRPSTHLLCRVRPSSSFLPKISRLEKRRCLCGVCLQHKLKGTLCTPISICGSLDWLIQSVTSHSLNSNLFHFLNKGPLSSSTQTITLLCWLRQELLKWSQPKTATPTRPLF